MKITTKLAASSTLLIILLLGVLVYDVSVVRRLAMAQEELAGAEQRAMAISLEQRQVAGRLDELTRKLFVTRDPDYAQALLETRRAFDALLADLESLPLSEAGVEIVARLATEWRELPLTALAEQAVLVEPGSEEEALLLASFREVSRTLQEQTDEVTRVAEQTVQERVQRSAAMSRNARTFSWIAALSALMLAVPTLWLSLSSIRRPLEKLHEGAQSVARGEYSYRIDDLDGGEFAELASKFNDMVRSLDLREKQGRDVLSHLSHELKTPLVAMLETNRLLLDGLPGALTAKQKRLIELNLDSGERLSEMISKLLDFARLEEGLQRLDVNHRDLGELAARAVEALSATAADAGIELALSRPEAPLEAMCDGDRITQVLLNLLDNAIKFAPDGSMVRVTVEALDSRQPRTAMIEVSDQGPGIPEEKREAIFERFTQLEGAKRSGIGLGLAISRQIALAHQGSLSVFPNEDGGSTFCLSLPAAGLAEVPAAGALA